MGPGATIGRLRPQMRSRRGGIVWSSVVAILFATFAAISFAVDQSVSIATFPNLEQHSASP